MRMLFAAVLVLFQSHWLDDVGSGSGEPDTAGITVSAIVSTVLIAGFLGRRFRVGRIALGLGILFVVLVSLADLIGIQPDGTLVPNLGEHWRFTLGPMLVLAVATTLVCALALLMHGARDGWLPPSG